jgi:iron complex outermembrane receptor protein
MTPHSASRPIGVIGSIFLFAALAATSAVAQEAQPPAEDKEIPRLPSTEVVTVTAPRVEIPLSENPAATTVVEGKDLAIARSKTIAADEALKLVPGVKVDNQADGERVHLSIRGEGILTERGVRRIMVLLDGIPLNDPLGLAPDLFDVDWATVRRVEVLRGPASALYGAGAAGGVINIATRDGGPGKASGDVALDLGSYSFGKLFAEAGGTVGSTNYRVAASRMQGDGYRVHTAYDATNIYSKIRWNVGSRGRLTAILASTEYFNENAEGLNLEQATQDPTLPNPDAVSKNEYQYTRRTTVGLTGDFSLTPAQDLSFAVYSRLSSWRESVPASLIYRTYDNPGGQLQYALRTGSGTLKNELCVGTDAAWQTVDEQKNGNPLNEDVDHGLQSSVSYDQQGIGLFAVDRLDVGHGWGVTGGLRWDGFQDRSTDRVSSESVDLPDYRKTTGRVGVTWNPSPRYGLYANWGQGFLPPSTEELINNPEGFGGFNAGIGAATSHGEEVGVRGSSGKRFTYDAALFRLDTENDFGRYRIEDRPLETFYYNAGASRRYGLETAMGWYPLDGLALQLAYTYSDFKYTYVISPPNELPQTTYTDTWLPNAPKHQGYLDAAYRTGSHWTIGASFEGQSRSWVDPANESWAWGYGLVHLRLAYAWESRGCGGEVTFVVRNATDRNYIAFTEPDPDGNSYHPAPGRELFLGARLHFGPAKKG